MSQLLFKIMANSYYRHHEQNTLFQDCLSALTTSLQSIDSKITSQIRQIKQVLSMPSEPSQNEMSVIIEEQTERSINQGRGYQLWVNRLKEQFNTKIGKLKKVQVNAEKLINIYKTELLDISKQMAKWESKNQQLKKQIKRINKLAQKLTQQNNQLKDQITAQSAQLFFKEQQQIQSVFNVKNTKQEPSNPKLKIKNPSKDKKEQIKKTQQKKVETEQKQNNSTPKFVMKSEQSSKRQQKQPNIIQINIRQEDNNEDLQKWKKLSKKIDELKNKLVMYEQQIQEKDKQIKSLKQQIKQIKAQQLNEGEDKKKLKAANTTLRGQKTVLQNQLSMLKKQFSQKSQLCNIQQSEMAKLKQQVQNLTQTIKWQQSTIEQLRSSYTKTYTKSNQQFEIKIHKLQNTNQQLLAVIDHQQKQLELFDKRTKQIDEKLQSKLQEYTGRITELQLILQQKNQCIVKMKTKGIGNENANPNIPNNSQNTYLNELVRVLTKKVADRDEIIRKLGHGK